METVYLAVRVLLSLAVVLGVLWVVHRRLTRTGRLPGAVKQVNVVTRQVIAPKASVVVVDVDGQRFLLGVTEQSVTVLNTGDVPEAQAIEAKAPPRLKAVPRATAPTPAVPGPASGSTAFARVMSDLAGPTPKAEAPIAYLAPGNRGTLDGSILSATTWKRTAAALRRAR